MTPYNRDLIEKHPRGANVRNKAMAMECSYYCAVTKES